MIKSVKNISRKQFERLNFYPTSENPTRGTHAYISIRGTDSEECHIPRVKENLWFRGIKLVFDDVDTTDSKILGTRMTLFSQDQAEEIIKFVQFIQADPVEMTLIIHCWAGVSRSAAVGFWINDAFKLHLPNYRNGMLYNRFVYNQLVQCWDRLNTI